MTDAPAPGTQTKPAIFADEARHDEKKGLESFSGRLKLSVENLGSITASL